MSSFLLLSSFPSSRSYPRSSSVAVIFALPLPIQSCPIFVAVASLFPHKLPCANPPSTHWSAICPSFGCRSCLSLSTPPQWYCFGFAWPPTNGPLRGWIQDLPAFETVSPGLRFSRPAQPSSCEAVIGAQPSCRAWPAQMIPPMGRWLAGAVVAVGCVKLSRSTVASYVTPPPPLKHAGPPVVLFCVANFGSRASSSWGDPLYLGLD